MNALAFLFQYKKLRRSLRLEVKANDTKPKSEDNNDDDDRGSIGLFELLPLELKFHIFTYLTGMACFILFSQSVMLFKAYRTFNNDKRTTVAVVYY